MHGRPPKRLLNFQQLERAKQTVLSSAKTAFAEMTLLAAEMLFFGSVDVLLVGPRQFFASIHLVQELTPLKKRCPIGRQTHGIVID